MVLTTVFRLVLSIDMVVVPPCYLWMVMQTPNAPPKRDGNLRGDMHLCFGIASSVFYFTPVPMLRESSRGGADARQGPEF